MGSRLARCAVAVLLLLGATGCGVFGGDEAAPPSASVPTPTVDASQGASHPDTLTLGLTAFPTGTDESRSGPLSLQTASGKKVVFGYFRQFDLPLTPGRALPTSVQSRAGIVHDSKQAATVVLGSARFPPKLTPDTVKSALNAQWSIRSRTVQLSSFQLRGLGRSSRAYRARIQGTLADVYLIAFRKGNAVGAVWITAEQGSLSRKVIVDLAHRAFTRLSKAA